MGIGKGPSVIERSVAALRQVLARQGHAGYGGAPPGAVRHRLARQGVSADRKVGGDTKVWHCWAR